MFNGVARLVQHRVNYGDLADERIQAYYDRCRARREFWHSAAFFIIQRAELAQDLLNLTDLTRDRHNLIDVCR
jgi:hypothetical protein